MRSIEKQGMSVVMIGAFNPTIFQPRWLGSLKLIREDEAENATIELIQSQVSDFKTDWFRMQVLDKRFLIQSLDATHPESIRDLAIGIFSLLPHTPVNRMFISRWFHYEMESENAWHDVGNKLAPKDYWLPFVKNPGLRSIMMEGKRAGIEDGTLFVRIEPSSVVIPGIFIEVTEQYIVSADGEPGNAQWVRERLTKHWEEMMEYAVVVADGLVTGKRT
jgi:hypothetical protein